VRDKLSQPYKIEACFSFVYLKFLFLDSKMIDRRFLTEWYQAFPKLSLLHISSWSRDKYDSMMIVMMMMNKYIVPKRVITNFINFF
jgi:hypothetical protein